MSNALQLQHRCLDGLTIALSSLPPGSPVGVHQIACEGSWDGHWQGPFSLSRSTFDQIAQYASVKRVDTPVDYEHATLAFGQGAPAAGWVKGLQIRQSSDGSAQLWATVEWTAKAAAMIRDREYKYVSPTILFNTKDRVSGRMLGASLHSVALTNVPFLHELPELRLNSLRAAPGLVAGAAGLVAPPLALTPEEIAACASCGMDPEDFLRLNQLADDLAAGRAELAREVAK